MQELVWLVDDDIAQRQMESQALQHRLRYRALAMGTQEAAQRLHQGEVTKADLMLIQIEKNNPSPLGVIREARRISPSFPILAFARYGEQDGATKAMEAGASDFLIKPVAIERLKLSLQQAMRIRRMSHYIAWLERKMAGHVDFSDLVGDSAAFKEALDQARTAALSKFNVWIEGEPGTGKELLARAIHGGSDRAGKPFIVVNCDMLPEHMAAAILFGRDNGRPSGLSHFMLGKLREAGQGTLLLKEAGALSSDMQRRLLALLEEGKFRPIDGQEEIPAQMRLICTSSRALESHEFLPKLLAWLRRDSISMPPLARRNGDVGRLAEHFFTVHAASENKYLHGLTDRAKQWLAACPWPGNVGQLANVIWRAVLLCDREQLDISELEMVLKSRPVYVGEIPANLTAQAASLLVDERGQVKPLKSVEQEAIRFALEHSSGCMTRAAKILGIGRSTLYRKVGELEMTGYISRASQTTRPLMAASLTDRS